MFKSNTLPYLVAESEEEAIEWFNEELAKHDMKPLTENERRDFDCFHERVTKCEIEEIAHDYITACIDEKHINESELEDMIEQEAWYREAHLNGGQ